LKIGTATPTEEQLKSVKHYFVGSISIDNYYNASMYEQDVLTLLDKQFKHSSIQLLTGGSMMYIDAVCNGIDDIPTIREDIREEMKKRYANEGLEALCEDLRRLDPEHYEIVDKKNYRRVIHALEICYQTGRTYTSFRRQEKKQRPFKIIKIGLNRERGELYHRINLRVDQMMTDGLLDEVQSLQSKRTNNALNTVGYKEMFTYLDGTWSLEEAVERIKGNTRRYARKQLTWFKRDEEMRWFHPQQKEDILKYISQYE
jgi:tRNA dimethylallyltransferase